MEGSTETQIRMPWTVWLLAAVIAPAVVIMLLMTPPPSDAAFPGQNGLIAFGSDRDGDFEVFIMNADGSGLTNLTNNVVDDGNPAWSADGSKIIFRRTVAANPDIYVMNADGSGQTRLTTDPQGDGFPKFCPDGRIVFVSDRDNGGGDIFIMNGDGSGQTNLTNDAAVADMPSCSPDGQKIAFKRLPLGSEISVMNLDGTGEMEITGASVNDEEYPDWSPDNLQIIVQSDADIYKMNADGSSPTNLTNSGAVPFDGRPVYSPDSVKIAFQSVTGVNNEIYTMNADGSGQTNLTNSPAFDGSPNWQPVALAPGTPPPVFDTTAPVITSLKITRKFSRTSKKTPVAVTTSKKKKKKVKRGATIRYTLSEAATVQLAIERKKRGYKIKQKGKKKKRCVSRTKKNKRRLTSQIKSKFKKKKISRKRLRREIRKAKCTLYINRGTLIRSGSAGKNKVSFSGRIGKRRLARASYRLTVNAIDPSGNISKTKRRSFKIVTATKKKAKKK